MMKVLLRLVQVMADKWRQILCFAPAVALIAVALLSTILTGQYRENAVLSGTAAITEKYTGFEIYLAKEAEDGTAIDKLVLEETPIISKEDIISYNWELHILKLKKTEKISRDLLQRDFVVVADGERIYQGKFWTLAYSMWPPKVPIYIDNLQEGDAIYIAIGRWLGKEELKPLTRNIISDDRIKKVLERDGLLIKPESLKNFARPDYVRVSYHQVQADFAYIDRELQDRLLLELDKRFTEDLEPEVIDLGINIGGLYGNETVVSLGYNELQTLTLKGSDKQYSYRELVMPLTGVYSGSLILLKEDGSLVASLGGLDRFTGFGLIKQGMPPVSAATEPPKPPKGSSYIYYHSGEPFYGICYKYFVLDSAAEDYISKMMYKSVCTEKTSTALPKVCSLYVRYGVEENERFYVLDNKGSLFSNGNYYENPELCKFIISILKNNLSVDAFDPDSISGIVEARYSFAKEGRIIEASLEDRTVLSKMEASLQKAENGLGGKCPFSDGVLTLFSEDGRRRDYLMASDGCPIMFAGWSFYEYPKELYDLFQASFNNFPYVEE